MKPSTLAQFLNMAAVAYGAILPEKRSLSCDGDVVPTSVTVISTQNQTQVVTITKTQVTTMMAPPGTVTVALQDPPAITSSLSSAFSVESQQLDIASQIAPINPLTSGRPPPETSATVFTRTIAVPVVEVANNATIAGQRPTADVYFIGESNGTTSWLTNFTPEESMTIGTTTVTLSPVATTSSSHISFSRPTARATTTSESTATLQRQTWPASAPDAEGAMSDSHGWNSSAISTGFTAGNPTCSGTPALSAPWSSVLVTVRRSSTIATTTVPRSAPTSIALPTGVDGSTVNIDFPTSEYHQRKRSADDHHQGAVCEWITATLRGTPFSWPNNWDGSKTVDCATFNTPPGGPRPTAPAITSVAIDSTSVPEERVSRISSASVLENTASSLSNPESVISMETTSCGVSGDFTLDFDTLPVFSPPDNDTAPFPPIFNPYRNLFFSSGWAYVPPPTVPVSPQEGNHLAVYVPTASGANNSVSQSSNDDVVQDGAFGAGPRASIDAYWFNAKTLYAFCDNGATDPATRCDVVVTGYRWDEARQSEHVVVTQHFPQPPCPDYRDCQTNEIFLDDEFRQLSSVSLYGTVAGQQKIIFIDTVRLTWWNQTCDAELVRASQV